eukprot:TRINITY_DN20180_c0_g1_i1.p1 TRINITY_DN20180_c0_g1~~TRINITY_DN20180_c0_g1_i1.p1  ORF type:complete len:536 (+),score=193.84 TRINITY_DN20180_c0_g1_i1:46-1608(+)
MSQHDDQPSWLPFDLDDVFAYRTPKVVKIRDRRLGCARILIMLAVFVYIVVYEVIINKGYLLKEQPTGFITTSLRRGSTSSTLPSYCRDGADGNNINGTLPCIWLDETDTLVPPGEEFSMFISTRITVVDQTLTPGCSGELIYKQNGNDVSLKDSDSGNICSEPTTFSVLNKEVGRSYFTGDIENFTMLWSHAVYGPNSGLQRHHSELHYADLVPHEGSDMHFVPRYSNSKIGSRISEYGYVGVSNGDILTIDTFLKSVDLTQPTLNMQSLTSAGAVCPTGVTTPDDCPDTCYWNGPICDATTQATCNAASFENGRCKWNSTAGACEATAGDYCQVNTIRYDGAVFLILIEYKTPEYTSDSLGYDYKLKWIRKSEYKLIEKVKNGNSITYYNRHGMRLIFVQTGFMTSFSFLVLLTTLVTAVALLEIANIVVIYLVMNFLPASEVYDHYRTMKSVDFSEVNVTKEDPLGGVTHDQFVYGMLHPGGSGSVKKHANEPVPAGEEMKEEEPKEEQKPDGDHTV